MLRGTDKPTTGVRPASRRDPGCPGPGAEHTLRRPIPYRHARCPILDVWYNSSYAPPRSYMVPDIRVGHYKLVPVHNVHRDDIQPLLGQGAGVYVCNCPEPAWYERFSLPRRQNHGVDKKRLMFAQMATGSRWLSMTHDEAVAGTTRTWESPSKILHLGRGSLRGRAAQLAQMLQLLLWLGKHRNIYSYCYVYNFDLPQYVAPLLAKVLWGKRLLIDYEDDYTTYRDSPFKNALERWMRRTCDGVVCVNEDMRKLFPGVPTCVLNTFADLTYTNGLAYELKNGMTFLYSGRLDDIRGADLLPNLVEALRGRLDHFTVRVTGGGPLQDLVKSWRLPELEYLGFVSDAVLEDATRAADACLILQKPDHPFSRGSYPSKIETYARMHKPIYALAETTA